MSAAGRLGIGVQVSAQSWQGLGADEDERYRIAATADGGIWLLRTPYPQPVCELAGTRRMVETATKVIGGMWGDEGSSRVQHAWTVDPQHRPRPGHRAGRLHPRRRLHLGPDRPPPPLTPARSRHRPPSPPAVVIPAPAARAAEPAASRRPRPRWMTRSAQETRP